MAATTVAAHAETALDRAVREAVAAAPPLSGDTRDELARLLSHGGER